MKLIYFIKYRELNYIMSMDLIENILVPHNDATLSVFIDLAKTFESVSHPQFLEPLQNIGIRAELFKIYLTNRKQIVKRGTGLFIINYLPLIIIIVYRKKVTSYFAITLKGHHFSTTLVFVV